MSRQLHGFSPRQDRPLMGIFFMVRQVHRMSMPIDTMKCILILILLRHLLQVFPKFLLKCTARPHLLKLLQNITHAPIQIGRDRLLLRVRQETKALTQIPINNAFDRNIVTPVSNVVSAN